MPKSDNKAREQRILDAAADLFIHYGYDKTTVDDIARQAGISKGAIYLHFKSKDDLFESLLAREMSRYAEEWFALIERDPNGGTIAGVYKNSLYALGNNPFISAIFKRDGRLLGNYLRKPDNLFRAESFRGIRADFLRMMQEAGAVRSDIDPHTTAHIMNILAYGLIGMDEIMPQEQIPATDDLIEAIAEMMDRALTPADGGNSEAGKAIIRQMADAARQQF